MQLATDYPEIEKTKNDFLSANEAVLMDILSRNSACDYGAKYDFAGIDSYEEYKSKVPVTTYDDYEPYIERIIKGEENITTSDELYTLLKTSATTRSSKCIPLTKKALSTYGDVSDRFMQSVSKKGGKRLMISFFYTDITKANNPLDTMLVSTAYYRYLYENNLIDIDKLLGGERLNFFENECDYLYVKFWMALSTAHICSFEAMFVYDLLLLFKYLEDNYDRLIEDMKKGRVAKEANLSPAVAKALLSLPIDEGRLDFVKRQCDAGFDNIVARLWPDCEMVSGIASKSFKVEEIFLKKYIGSISVWHFIYGASECFMSVNREPDSYEYVLISDTAFYEFLSVGKEDNTICNASQLTVGEDYELVITNYSGLYRYRMGDVIRITDFYGSVPVFKFMYRENLKLNIAGEKIDSAKLDKAVMIWSKDVNMPVWQYYFYEDFDHVPARYRGVIGVGTDDYEINNRQSEIIFDNILKSLSDDYLELRNMGNIDMVSIRIESRDEFMRNSYYDGQRKGQNKTVNIRRKL